LLRRAPPPPPHRPTIDQAAPQSVLFLGCEYNPLACDSRSYWADFTRYTACVCSTASISVSAAAFLER
jgi:hypothetical protein